MKNIILFVIAFFIAGTGIALGASQYSTLGAAKIFNNQKVQGVDQPVVIDDNLNLKGELSRRTARPGDDSPVVVQDDLEVRGDVKLGIGDYKYSLDDQITVLSDNDFNLNMEMSRLISFIDCIDEFAKINEYVNDTSWSFCNELWIKNTE